MTAQDDGTPHGTDGTSLDVDGVRTVRAPRMSLPGSLRSALARWRVVQGLLPALVVPALVVTLVAGSTASAVTVIHLAGSSRDPSNVLAEDVLAEDDPPQAKEFPSVVTPSDSDDVDTVIEVPAPSELVTDPDPLPPTTDDASPEDGPSDEMLGMSFAEAVERYGRPDYAAVLSRAFAGAQWSLNGNDVEQGLTWFGPGPRPTRDQLDLHWSAVAAELEAERERADAAAAAAAQQRAAEVEARRADPAVQSLLESFDPRSIWGESPDYAAVLTRRFPGAQWSLSGNDPDGGLTWYESSPQPTRGELEAMWAEVAHEMALEMDPAELARWAGTGDEVYVEGVLRPKGWVGGANDPQPAPVATPENLQYLPQVPHTNGGSPVGTIEISKDPTGSKNFEQLYGVQLHDLGALIAQAHGYFGGSYGLGLSLNGDRELMWYSDQVDPQIVADVLASLGALPEPETDTPDPEPETDTPVEGDAQD